MSDKKLSNADVTAKHKQFLFASTATYYDQPVALESGKGCYVRDFDGNKYLDFFGGILTISVGHANDKVNAAVRAQAERLGHVSTVYPTLPVVELAEKLVKLSPGQAREGVLLRERHRGRRDGHRPRPNAHGAAGAHRPPPQLLGRSLLAQSVTGHAKYRVIPTQVAAVKHAHAPYCYRCPFGLDVPELRRPLREGRRGAHPDDDDGADRRRDCGAHHGRRRVHHAARGWMKTFVDIIRKYGGIFISDEVQTGFGRTGGKMWGIQHEGVSPT